MTTKNLLTILCAVFIVPLLACGLGTLARSEPAPTATILLASFSTSTPVATSTPTSALPTATAERPVTATPESIHSTPTQTLEPEPATVTPTATASPTTAPPSPTPQPAPIKPAPPPSPTPAPAPDTAPAATDFVVRLVRMRTNEENSWDGTLNGVCGSDHSIYAHVVDAQENFLDGVLVGDRYGNFEVPTGVDGPGQVRIQVWSATMELAVMGHQDGTRYTSAFTPPLSTLDEDIPLDWLQQSGYCDSPEDCRQRVESNQLCRGHYSYDVVFQRTW